ncbi:MAG: chorismate mutase [Clostridia bacterium]|nr:chorismate mutase [Clostridia bacterium]
MSKGIDLIEELRCELDEIDSDIAELLQERYDVCLQIAREKRLNGIALENLGREEEIIFNQSAKCSKYSEEAKSVFRSIIDGSKRLQRQSLNLYLVGMPNSGKTKLAGRLGLLLGRRRIDTDSLVMRSENKTIDRIFDESGEAYFREIEHQVLCRAAATGDLVVATGGGILTYEKNLPILKNSGVTVFLDRDPECLARARVHNRPLIRGGIDDIMRLYNERIEQYRSESDLTVDPDDEAAVEKIAEFFNGKIS